VDFFMGPGFWLGESKNDPLKPKSRNSTKDV